MLQQVDQVDRVEEVDMARFIQQLESHMAAEVGNQLTPSTKAASQGQIGSVYSATNLLV